MATTRTPADIPRITVDELRRLIQAGQHVVILDIRSPKEYDWLHIAGAQLVSPERLTELKLPPEAEIVTY